MKKLLVVLSLLGAVLFINGCGGSGSSSSDLNNLIDQNTPSTPDTPSTPGTPDTPDTSGTIVPPGELGSLVDLGDLFAFTSDTAPGDHWYYTKAAGINDSGVVIGQSNRGNPVKAAFSWDPATEQMTYLGIHTGTFDDYYNIKFEQEDPPKPFIYSEAVDINQSGLIIGNSTTGSGWPDDQEKRAFLWKDGSFIDLVPPPYQVPGPTFVDGKADNTQITLYTVTGKYSEAVDINNKGEVVLTMDDSEGRHAYYWDGVDYDAADLGYYDDNGPTGPVSLMVPHYVLLGRIVGADSEAVAINENGQTVINSGGTVVFHDLNWNIVESLNHLPGTTKTEAVDINDSIYTNNDGIPDGHVIGNSGNGSLKIGDDGSVRGFFWDGGAMYPVSDLGGGSSVATDINDHDQVVGGATTADGSYHAYIWTLGADKKGVIQDLGTLGGANSFATAINETGQVVGWAETGQQYEEDGVVVPVRHAFLWSGGKMYDLGTHNYFYNYPFVPSFPFSEAVGVNSGGQVAGNSITINDHYRGFFLSPVF